MFQWKILLLLPFLVVAPVWADPPAAELHDKSSGNNQQSAHSRHQVIFWDLNDHRNLFGPRKGQIERICLGQGSAFGLSPEDFFILSEATAPELKQRGLISKPIHDLDALAEMVQHTLGKADSSPKSRIALLLNSHGGYGSLDGNLSRQVSYRQIFERLFGSEQQPGIVPVGSPLIFDIHIDACHSESAQKILKKALTLNTGRFQSPGEYAKYKNAVNLLTSATAAGVAQFSCYWDTMEATHGLTPNTSTFSEQDFALFCRLRQSPDGEENHHLVWSSYQKIDLGIGDEKLLAIALQALNTSDEANVLHHVQMILESGVLERIPVDSRDELFTKLFNAALTNPSPTGRTNGLKAIPTNNATIPTLLQEKILEAHSGSLLLSLLNAYSFPILGKENAKMADHFMRVFEDSSVDERLAITKILSGLGAPTSEAITAWIRTLLSPEREPDEVVRSKLVELYLKLQKNDLPFIESLLADPSALVRLQVLEKTRYLLGKDKLQSILIRATDPEQQDFPKVREKALKILDHMNPDRIALFNQALTDPDVDVRLAGISLLLRADQASIAPISNLIFSHLDPSKQNNANLRREFAGVAFRHKLVDDELLRKLLNDPAEVVRTTAWYNLEEYSVDRIKPYAQLLLDEIKIKQQKSDSISYPLLNAAIRASSDPIQTAATLMGHPATRPGAAQYLGGQPWKDLERVRDVVLPHADPAIEPNAEVRIRLRKASFMLAEDPLEYALNVLDSDLYSKDEKWSVFSDISQVGFWVDSADPRYTPEKVKARILRAIEDGRFAKYAINCSGQFKNDETVWRAIAGYLRSNRASSISTGYVIGPLSENWRHTLQFEDREIFWRVYNYFSDLAYQGATSDKDFRREAHKVRTEMDRLVTRLKIENARNSR